MSRIQRPSRAVLVRDAPNRPRRTTRYEKLSVIKQRHARDTARVFLRRMAQPMQIEGRPVYGAQPPPPQNTGAPRRQINVEDDDGIPPAPALGIPFALNPLAGRTGGRMYAPGAARRRKRFAGFSRRSFKFLRWLYHLRKKRRFTPAQAQNAAVRRQVFFRAWERARGEGRKYLTGADVKAAAGGYSTASPGPFRQQRSSELF